MDEFNITKILAPKENNTNLLQFQTARKEKLSRQMRQQQERLKFLAMMQEVDKKKNMSGKVADVKDEHKMESLVNGTGYNETVAAAKMNETSKRKPTFRDKKEKEMKDKLERERLKSAKIPKYLLGPDCESMICGSCKIIVDEFAKAVQKAINDPKYPYIKDIFEGFCSSDSMVLQYHPLVVNICQEKFENVSVDCVNSITNCTFGINYCCYVVYS